MTPEKTNKKLTQYILIFLFSFFTAGLFYSCEEIDSDLGLNYISPDDTIGTLMLDSKMDTITLNSNNFRYYISNSLSAYMLIGKSQNFESKGLTKFINITQDYDSATIVSATLKLQYNDYAYVDSLGNVSFDIFRILNPVNFSTLTYDSVTSSDIGTTSLGGYSGNPTDSAVISMSLDNQTAKDWLEYAADTNYSVKNNGIAFSPQMSSTAIKGFFSGNSGAGMRPTVEIILTKNSVTDTITLNESLTTYIATAPESVIQTDRIYLQSGIGFRNIMSFDLSKLPSNVIINDATLELTLDESSSSLTDYSDKRIIAGMVTDTTTKRDSLAFITLQPINGLYTARFIQIAQNWNSNVVPNYGLLLRNVSEVSSMDIFSFYGPTYSDTSKTPRLRIRYSLRNP